MSMKQNMAGKEKNFLSHKQLDVAYDSTDTKESKYVGCENQNNELTCTSLSLIKLNNGLLN